MQEAEVALTAMSAEPMLMAMSLPEVITDIQLGIERSSNGTVDV